MSTRRWETLRSAGRELATQHCDCSQIIEIVHEAERQFEISQTPEAQAVAVFLDGLTSALDAISGGNR